HERGVVDDRGLANACRANQEHWEEGAAHEERAAQVDGHHFVPDRGRGLEEVALDLDARVVDHHVDPSEAALDGGHQTRDGPPRAYIDACSDSATTSHVP